MPQDNIIIQEYADSLADIGLLMGMDETTYRNEVANLVTWCSNDNLSLSTVNGEQEDDTKHGEREDDTDSHLKSKENQP